MSKRPIDRIDSAFFSIVEEMRNGSFTRNDLEGIKQMAEIIVSATNKVIERATVPDKQRKDDE